MKLRLSEGKHPGRLVTFCGLDGSGKTTLIHMLDGWLKSRGVNAVLTRQPTDQIRNSEMFRAYMDKEDHSGYDYRALSLAAAADRVQHTGKFIVPLLEAGETVISDRYYYSCLANHRARGYDDPWVYEVGEHIQKPDRAFFIDIDAETAMMRVRERAAEKGRYIDVALQHRLREQYLMIADECGGVVIPSSECVKGWFYL